MNQLICLFLLVVVFPSTAKANPVLPRWQEIAGKMPTVSGPNCWNETLFLSGIVSGLRYTGPEEFRYVLESPLCTKIEKPQLGDVVALRRIGAQGRPLRGAMFSEVHGYIYRDLEKGFSKNGIQQDAPYAILTHESIFQQYERSQKLDCRIQNIPREHCRLVREYYRCESWESFLAQYPWPNPEFKKFYGKIISLERELQQIYFAQSLDSEQDKAAARTQIQTKVDALQGEWDLYTQNLPESIYRDLLTLQLESMRVTQF